MRVRGIDLIPESAHGLILFFVGGFFYFIKAVVGECVLEQASFFFGSFFIHSRVKERMLEEAVPLVDLFSHLASRFGQIEVVVLNSEKAALLQERNGTAHTRLAHSELFRNIHRARRAFFLSRISTASR